MKPLILALLLSLSSVGLGRTEPGLSPRLASGTLSAFFISEDGRLFGMGGGSCGQLGRGDVGEQPAPILIEPASVTAVSAGYDQTVFLKSDNTLWGMGYTPYLGIDPVGDVIVATPIAENVKAASAGYYNTLFIGMDGSLWGFGSGFDNQLGGGQGSSAEGGSPAVKIVDGGVASVSGGHDHSLFVKSDGTLWGMGSNAFGQLGDGSLVTRKTPIPIASGVSQACAGSYLSFFIKTDGSLWGMGRNENGELGDGSTMTRNRPVQILDRGAAAVSSHESDTLILMDDGSLRAIRGEGASGKVPEIIVASGVEAIGVGGCLFRKADKSVWAARVDWYGASRMFSKAFKLSNSPVEFASLVPINQNPSQPVITPNGGTIQRGPYVSASSATPGAYMRFTTDNSEPSPTSAIFPANLPIELSYSSRLKVKSFKFGWNDGGTSSAQFVVNGGAKPIATPVITPNGGTFRGKVKVSISCATQGVQLSYSNYGTIPNRDDFYRGFLVLRESAVVCAVARWPDGSASSDLAKATFEIIPFDETVATPVISPAAPTFKARVRITLSCATPGATIRYTTNGTAPTEQSPVYRIPLIFSRSVSVSAMAFKTGFNDSPVASALFTKQR